MPLLTLLEGWHRVGPPILVEQQAQTTFPAEGLKPDTQNVVPFPKLVRIGSHRVGPPILVKQQSFTLFPTEGSDRFIDTPITHPLVKFAIGHRGPVAKVSQPAFQTEAALVVPAAAALTVTGAVPAIALPIGVSPASVALVLAPTTPAVALPVQVSPAASALTLTRGTPAVALPIVVNPAALMFALAFSTPAVSLPIAVAPSAAALLLSLATPAVVTGDNIHVSPEIAALNLALATPAVTTGSSADAGANPAGGFGGVWAGSGSNGQAEIKKARALIDAAMHAEEDALDLLDII